MQVRFNKQNFKSKLHKELKPKTSWWALAGIVFFFFAPEIIAFIWGENINHYSDIMVAQTQDPIKKELYEKLKWFSENSIINTLIGIGFVWWFFDERKRTQLTKNELPKF